MKAVFVDAHYFIATLNPRDSAHARAGSIATKQWQRLVTTEWVLIEVANSLSTPILRGHVLKLIDRLRTRPNVEIVYSNPTLLQEGIDLYRARTDKHWSLTDCLSFCVMRKQGIVEALTADAHFEQAGFVAVLR